MSVLETGVWNLNQMDLCVKTRDWGKIQRHITAYFGSVVPGIDSGVGIEQGPKGTKIFAFEELSGHSK